MAALCAVGGLGVLGYNNHRFTVDPNVRRTINMSHLIVPLAQWGAIMAVWLWLVIAEAKEKRAARQVAPTNPPS